MDKQKTNFVRRSVAVRALVFRLLAVGLLLYWLFDLVKGYLAGGEDAPSKTLLIIGISACLAGAVFGDHCSPISDTTIMASAGAMSNHLNHVRTQLPYAITVGLICFVNYILAGWIQNWIICLAIGIVLTIGTLFVLKALNKEPATAKK